MLCVIICKKWHEVIFIKTITVLVFASGEVGRVEWSLLATEMKQLFYCTLQTSIVTSSCNLLSPL